MRDWLTASPVADTPAEWRIAPRIEAGDEVCLFLTYAAGGRIAAHALYQARAWAQAGFKLVLVVTIDELAGFDSQPDLGFASGMLLRLNRGYDFGGWAAAIRGLPQLRDAKRLAIANDSVYGPLKGFAEMLGQVRASDIDFLGVVESREKRHHYQSFLLFFGSRALRSDGFWRFWRRVRNGTRDYVIDRYEIRLLNVMLRSGLSSAALFPAEEGDRRNQTLAGWRALIEAGFPFIKARLVRDAPAGTDPSGWREVLSERGYDVRLIDEHLGITPVDAATPVAL